MTHKSVKNTQAESESMAECKSFYKLQKCYIKQRKEERNMKVRNPLSQYKKISKEDIIGQTLTIKDIIEVNTENGIAYAVILEDDSYTYAPSCDVDWLQKEVYNDEVEMAEVRSGAYTICVQSKTSKSGRQYYTMF